MHRRHKNTTDDRKSAQIERQQNRSSSLSLFVFRLQTRSTVPLPDLITLRSHNIPFSDSARNLGFILDSKLSMKKHVIKSRTAGFSLKMQPKFLLLPVSSHGSVTTATVPSWVHVCHPTSPNSKLCCKTRSLGTPPPTFNTSPGKTALASHFRTH